jgi:hypothetical protein
LIRVPSYLVFGARVRLSQNRGAEKGAGAPSAVVSSYVSIDYEADLCLWANYWASSGSFRRARTQTATRAAVKPAPAPIPSAQRGPKWLATHPMIGAPITFVFIGLQNYS